MKFIFLLTLLVSVNVFAAFSKTTDAVYTATTTPTQVLAANHFRTYLLVQNRGSVVITVNVGATLTSANGIQIPAGGNWEPLIAPQDTIWLTSASSTSVTEILEGN